MNLLPMGRYSSRTVDPTGQERQIAAYLGGDAAAFQEVDGWIRGTVEGHYPVLRPDIEDLCQIVHIKLMANLKAGRFLGRSRLRSYVVGIAHYTAIDLMRRLYRDRALRSSLTEGSEDTGPSTPYQSLASLEEGEIVRQVLLAAPAGCRELWRMSFFEKLTYEEIAARLSIPVGTVKSRVWHCRRKAMAMIDRLWRMGSRPRGDH